MMIYSGKFSFSHLSQKIKERELFSNIQYYGNFLQGIQKYHQIAAAILRNRGKWAHLFVVTPVDLEKTLQGQIRQ